jgi:hypothetical protein
LQREDGADEGEPMAPRLLGSRGHDRSADGKSQNTGDMIMVKAQMIDLFAVFAAFAITSAVVIGAW